MPRPNIIEFDGIGTRFWCESLDGSFDNSLKDLLVTEVNRFDRAYSRFRDDSLIADLYHTGKISNPPAELVDMFNFAHELFEISDGAFDITVGNVLNKFGYGRRDRGSELVNNFWQLSVISKDKICIPKNTTVDFGGFGKGWLIDSLAKITASQGYKSFIVNGGGDMYIKSQDPVEIALEDPRNPSEILQKLQVLGGFAASGQSKRRWKDGNVVRPHIVDVNDHDDSRQVLGTFVQAPSARVADAMATILFLRPNLHIKLSKKYNLKVLIV